MQQTWNDDDEMEQIIECIFDSDGDDSDHLSHSSHNIRGGLHVYQIHITCRICI